MNTALNMPIRKKGEQAVFSNGPFAMTLVVIAEAMFFIGLVCTYFVTRTAATVWPPLGQPRLPVEATLLNTVVLLLSAVSMWMAVYFSQSRKSLNKMWLSWATTILLGSLFLMLQGNEWVNLLSFGLTANSSLYGGFFYLIIGAHALHAAFGILALMSLPLWYKEGRLGVFSIYWYFVVGLWPIIYISVYLV